MRFRSLALPAIALSLMASEPAKLIDAIKDENRKQVESLIKSGADVNTPDPGGATPLAWSVYLNQSDTAARLIDAGAKVNTADDYGDTPLTLACATGNSQLIERLLAAGADPNAARWNGETALMLASRAGSIEGVKQLLAKGAKPDAVDSRKGQNALMWAAAEGHFEVVDLLLKAGADPKLTSKSGFSPLVFAAESGDQRSVQRLLDAGLDANYSLPDGITVLQVAVLAGKSAAAAVLLDHGARVQVADRNGVTPLHVAAQKGDVKLVEQILSKHPDLDARTTKVKPNPGQGGGLFRPSGEQTPLLLAARSNRVGVMRALVSAGADPKLKAQDGTTLLMAAASSGHVEAVKYAYELAPEINAVTDRGTTVMHAAVTGSMQSSTQPEICKVIQFLAEKGADPDALDARGRTPITIANFLPIDQAVDLLTKIIVDSGKMPKQSPKR
jgi:ankyrin repeat protein